MRSIWIPEFGDPDVLQLREVDSPRLGPGQVRIKAEAWGVNFADLLMRKGLYPEAPEPPFMPGYEVAGTVLELPPDGLPDAVAWLKPGMRVMAVTKFGGYAEEVLTPAVKVAPLPDGWTYEQGAGFLIAFVTAWLGLEPMARVREGDRVLVHGIAGGVGLAALQIARAAGAHVGGTCSAAKASAVKDLGAELVVDYRDEQWPSKVLDWAPGGPDIIYEPRGGAGIKHSLELVHPTGSVVVFGFREIIEREGIDPKKAEMTTGRLLWFNPLSLIQRSVGIHMLNIMNLWDEPWPFRNATDAAAVGMAAGQFRPIIDKVFPFADVAEAHQYLHDRKNIGKVVLSG